MRFGRPPKLTAEQLAVARRLIDEGTAVREAARILNVHTATLYRGLRVPVDRDHGFRWKMITRSGGT